ncbi:hypothetical protein ABD72_11120 [Brevibacillus laterosporus]|nr:hypothetical protein BrL25_22320 [Brevibacillus laterosporus DSM 25]MBG9802696.1 hypothetical protein [Brevibacillus laterosporus]TPH16362.1 N-acetyltransferase [Brevibacillus laterosporus]
MLVHEIVLRCIELNVFWFNVRATYVYEKLGFVQDGIQRDFLFYDHEYHDSTIMSVLVNEYRARKQKSK